MSAVETIRDIPWWKEPTKDQWYAFGAAWLGWTLDAFDFTIFLLIMVPIAKEFNVPLTDVTIVFTLTLWMRLVGATASGWMADRMGRKTPLMISIAWYSVCNFIAGFSPTFWFLLLFRALLGLGMGAEWPAGASLAMETWPIRSRGFMSGVLQGSWGLGFLLSSAGLRAASTIISAGAACCGSASPRRWRSSIFATLSKSPRSGSRTAGCSAPRTARSRCRCSRSSSAACSATR